QLYLYLDEPRGVTDDCACVPMSWRGAVVPGRNARCLCTGNPEVLNGLRQAVKRVFTEVPELGGVFCITHNENPTHCWSRATPEEPTDCPVCRAKGIVKTIAEVVEAIASGVHEAKPTARVLAWNWDWLQPWDLEIIRSLPNDVTLMCTSENRRETLVGGIPGVIADYSISKPGPGPTALRCWQAAQERGLPIAAKVQVNNSWELSAVPYIPVPGLVEEHLDNLRHLGIQDFMLSWSLGGYPGGNLALLVRPKKELYREWFGRAANLVLSACACFESGFRHFPFNQNYMLYRGPHNHGPANLFHADPTGYKSTMVGFSYDDLKTWRGIYPEAVFETEYEKLCEYWQTGLKALESAGQLLEENTKRAFKDLSSMAKTAYCHFRSTYLHIRFIRYRDAGQWGREMRQVLQEEIEVTQELLGLVRQDSRLGFEASNHYSYTEQILLESILCCHWILEHRCALQ
ncbi:MAG: hypothetical protein IJJ33_04355, partial [Victivallales bacterium]|nr:hypothetical protein [Victivallales bacterium]